MFFQGRGTVYLADYDATGVAKPVYKLAICPDAFGLSLSQESFSHTSKCGAVDVEDFRGTKSSSGELSLSFADVADKKFAMAVFGTTNATATGSVTAETLPTGVAIGDVYFCGGGTRHRTLTSVVVKDSAGSPITLALGTHYTLDAATGMITFVAVPGTQPYKVDYSYADPATVSLLTAAAKEYVCMFEYINKANNNAKGTVELFRVKFDPTQNMDFLSDELQIMELKGAVLADQLRTTTDTVFGQFGRRI